MTRETVKRWLAQHGQAALLVLGLLVHGIAAGSAARDVWQTKNGRDYASYYYAYKVASKHGDPYNTATLSKMAAREKTRTGVQPYFYPPPFLYTMSWARSLTLPIAYRGMVLLNELALAACLLALRKGFAMPLGAIGVLLAIWTPIPDNLRMGQANLIALLPALLGLWCARAGGRSAADRASAGSGDAGPGSGDAGSGSSGSASDGSGSGDSGSGGSGPDGLAAAVPPGGASARLVAGLAPWRPWIGGVLVGTAAMFKMSPALFLLYWALRREWRPIVAAMGTAVGLSLLSLPLVHLATQIEFYTVVLPGFARGKYHGLAVAISLDGNHSIPDIFNHWWPGRTKTELSTPAVIASRIVSVALLAFWAWRARRLEAAEAGRPGRAAARVIGALTVLLVILPTYTYEHHLVFLLLPAATLVTMTWSRWSTRRPGSTLDWLWLLAAVLVLFTVGWPLSALKSVMAACPSWLMPLVRESKFAGMLGMFFLLL